MAGSLIQLHYHDNLAILEKLSEVSGNLYYKNMPIFTEVSKETTNAIIKKVDGIYVDNTYFLSEKQYRILTKFDYYNGSLVYDNRIVSWDYTEDQLNVLHRQVWSDLEKDYPKESVIDGCFVTSDNKVIITQDKNLFMFGGD